MLCRQCNFENDSAVTYCERCGTYLQASTPYSQLQADFTISPPLPIEYRITPSIPYGMQSEIFSNLKISPPRPRITIFRVIRSILYFIATFIAAFGLIFTFNGLFGISNRAEGLAIFFGLGLLVAGVIIFMNMRHRVSQLRLAHFIWWILGATVGMFMAFILAFTLFGDSSAKTPTVGVASFLLGFIILLYGFVLAATSLW